MVCATSEGLIHVGAAVEDLTHMQIILLMASVRKMNLSQSSAPNSDTYLACKLDTIQSANDLLAHPSRFAGTMVGAWIIGSLLTVEVSLISVLKTPYDTSALKLTSHTLGSLHVAILEQRGPMLRAWLP